jgi:outer membrane receptor protein involved in Fe transport
VGGLAERRQENAASQIIGGIEFGGQWRVIPELALLGTATWTQGDTTLDTGEVVPADRIPPFNGIVGMRYEPPAGKFYVEPLLRYAGAQNRLAPNNRTDNRINPNGTPGFFVFDVRAGMLVSESLWLRLVAQNLTNNNYREHGSSLDGLGTNIFFNVDYRY